MIKGILAALLVLALINAVAIVRTRNLFGAAILLSIYSFLMALCWTVMEALDVAFTEAAVGAGISTILLLGALVHLGENQQSKEKRSPRPKLLPALAVAITGGVLIYGTFDMPRLGDQNAPVNRRASAFYVSQESHDRTHAPNIVTAVLASYRGYDTMFETAVIFTAGMGVILLMRAPKSETSNVETTASEEAPSDSDQAGAA